MPFQFLRLTTACALSLLLACAALTGCQSSSTSHDLPDASPTPLKITLKPGQRIEAVIVTPARSVKQRRVRGIIDDQHQLTLETLGTFNTHNQTLTQLQQSIVLAHNQQRKLQGTIRLLEVQRETAGLFIALTPAMQQAVLDDPAQRQALEHGLHPALQWITLPEGDDTLPAHLAPVMRQSKPSVLARTAAWELAGHTLTLNVQDHVLQQGLITQDTHLYTVKLHPVAADALGRASREAIGQQLLVVYQDQCIWHAPLAGELGSPLTLTSGPDGFTASELEALNAVFKPSAQ